MSYQYSSCALGGTFDHFHIGHKLLIETALSVSQKVCIGLTTSVMHADKLYAQSIQSFDVREKALHTFLSALDVNERVLIVPLDDVYGPTIDLKTDFDVLVVSEQTEVGAEVINNKRRSLGLASLPVVMASMVTDKSGEYISSTRIRAGLINSKGRVYGDLFVRDIDFDSQILTALSRPQGLIVALDSIGDMLAAHPRQIAVVGDRTLELFLENNLPFSWSAIDHRSGRQSYIPTLDFWQPSSVYSAINKAHGLSMDCWNVVSLAVLHGSGLIFVEGEEDLVALQFVLSLPLDTLVFYGQPNEGVVMMEVTQELKEQMARLIDDDWGMSL